MPMADYTPPRSRPLQRLRQNPIALKELRSRMRGPRAFFVLTAYLMAMGIFITLIYLAVSAGSAGPTSSAARSAGKSVFGAVIAIEVFLVMFIAPAFTAGAISGEKERQTYDLLRTTLLSPRAFVLGKLVSALTYVLLLIVASLPLQSLAFLLGGLSLSELIISQLLIVVAAIAYALWGLYCSSALKTTLAASVTTFAGAFFMLAGLPMLAALTAAIFSSMMSATGTSLTVAEVVMAYGAILLASVNLPAALVVSDVFLVEQNTLWGFQQTIGGSSYFIPSPWIIFLAVHIIGALILFRLTTNRVRRIER